MSAAPSTFSTRTLFESPVASFGLWSCPASSDLWNAENTIGPRPVLALPWTGVVIDRCAERGALVDPNCTVFYQSDESYHRGLASELGDRCAFIKPSPELIRSALQEAGLDGVEFPFAVGPAVSWATGTHHKLAYQLVHKQNVSVLEAEEILTTIVHGAVLAASRKTGRNRISRSPATVRAHRDLVHRTRLALLSTIDDGGSVLKLSMPELAKTVHSSPFHLCRIFKEYTSHSIAQHFMRLRLRHAAEQLSWSDQPITNTALRYGFSSHAHFSTAWASEFGSPPRELRNSDYLSNMLKAPPGRSA